MENKFNEMLQKQAQQYIEGAENEVKNNHLGALTKDGVSRESFDWVGPDIMAQLSEENKRIIEQIGQVEDRLIERRAEVLTTYKEQYGDLMDKTKEYFPDQSFQEREDKAYEFYKAYDVYIKNDAPYGVGFQPYPESLNVEVERFIPTREEFSQISEKWRDAIVDDSLKGSIELKSNIDNFNKVYMDGNRDKITEEIMSGLKDLNEQKTAFAEKYLTGPDKEIKAEIAGSILSYDENKMSTLAKSNERLRDVIEERLQDTNKGKEVGTDSIMEKVQRMAAEKGIQIPETTSRETASVNSQEQNRNRGMDI